MEANKLGIEREILEGQRRDAPTENKHRMSGIGKNLTGKKQGGGGKRTRPREGREVRGQGVVLRFFDLTETLPEGPPTR